MLHDIYKILKNKKMEHDNTEYLQFVLDYILNEYTKNRIVDIDNETIRSIMSDVPQERKREVILLEILKIKSLNISDQNKLLSMNPNSRKISLEKNYE
jgi:hypothetical protein